jgi:hypothetical protein
MNRGFLILLAPALLVALLYWGLGYRPSVRGVVGVLIFIGLLVFILRRKGQRV